MTGVRRSGGYHLERHDPALVVHPAGWWAVTDGQVVISPTQERDIPAIATAVGDAHARRMLRHWADFPAGPAAYRRERVADELLGPYSPDLMFTVFANGSAVGVRWISSRSSRHDGGSCGGWTHQALRGRGVSSAALRLALHHYARNVDGKLVITGTRTENVAAARALRAAGFRFTGTERERSSAFEEPTSIDVYRRDLDDLLEYGPMPVAAGYPFRLRSVVLEIIMGKKARS